MTSTKKAGMLSEGEKAKTIRYISDRHCPSGGYCFYQLDEPNLSDTWYALGSLQALNVDISDQNTLDFLFRFHDQTIGSSGLYRLWYLFWSYKYLTGKVPDDLVHNLKQCPPPLLFETGTIESTSMFESLYCYTVLYAEAGIETPISVRKEIQEKLLKWQHSSGGFGRDKATLIETWHAVAICNALNRRVVKNPISSFLEQCVDYKSGFVNVPSSHPGYLEHLDAGISLTHLLDLSIPNKALCIQYLEKCRNDNGGYARSVFGGNSTLENTWFAIRSLARLNGLKTWRW